MARTGIGFLDKAREELGDPSIAAGRSVAEKPVTGLRSTKQRFQASARFLERSGGMRGSLTAPADIPEAIKDTTTDLPSTKEDASSKGFVTSFSPKGKTMPARPTANFGLPTDRLPTIDELGGAIGGFAKYVSQLTKFNRARGLSPGIPITKTKDRAGVGLIKAKLTTLTKLHETATLSGDTEKASKIEEMINAILQGDDASFDEGIAAELSEIAGLEL